MIMIMITIAKIIVMIVMMVMMCKFLALGRRIGAFKELPTFYISEYPTSHKNPRIPQNHKQSQNTSKSTKVSKYRTNNIKSHKT